MARGARVLVDEGVYHITSRGHNRYRLYHSLSDYKIYKNLIVEHKKKFCFDIYHYCLMPNHTHMLLKVKTGHELPRIMQGINQSYAKYYKRKYRFIGNLFQGRYKSILIDNDEYLMECGRYIERNPLRAKMVVNLSKYHFSSYNCYANDKFDDIITPDPCFLALSSDPQERTRSYREYLLQKRPYETMLDIKLNV